MSINLLLADDEYFIRQRLKKIIPWTALNLNFVGEAENGQEVLDAFKKHTIDILILDIKMPKMTGIQAAEYIHTNYPMVKIIILSGYNDFEYARTAMHYGVTDYLLKPVDEISLKVSLEDCIKKINAANLQHMKMQKYYHYEKCTALANVQNGTLDIASLYSDYPEFKQITHSLYIGIYIFDETEETIHLFVNHLREARLQCEYSQETEYIYVVQIFFISGQTLQIADNILAEFAQNERQGFFLSAGNQFPLSENWQPHYKQLLDSLNQRYFSKGIHSVSMYEPPTESIYIAELPKIRQNVTLFLNNQDEQGFCSYVEELFDFLAIHQNSNYLYSLVMELFMTYHIYYHVPKNQSQNISEFISSILDEEYILENLKNTTVQYGLQCIKNADASPSDVALSKKLMTYIQEHYKVPDLTVAKLADVYQLNPSYMGTIFKKVNNLSILQYITNVRMEISKLLLESNQYKIAEIAEMVGYSDVFYFSKRFKKSYGCSPKDYALRSQS